MNLKTIITITTICISAVFGHAQHNAHNQAHSRLLANHANPIQRSIVLDLLQEEIEARESEYGLSVESEMMIDDILKEAHKYIGVRYRYGAKGPNAFDCSGYTSYIYKQFGFNLSPASRMQYTQGVAVARNDLRKGDLVFFTSRRSGKNVGHVGIVVSANNETGDFKFIHASINGVKVSDFEGYYRPRYVGARRIITE